jgi:hypothetical protein
MSFVIIKPKSKSARCLKSSPNLKRASQLDHSRNSRATISSYYHLSISVNSAVRASIRSNASQTTLSYLAMIKTRCLVTSTSVKSSKQNSSIGRQKKSFSRAITSKIIHQRIHFVMALKQCLTLLSHRRGCH